MGLFKRSYVFISDLDLTLLVLVLLLAIAFLVGSRLAAGLLLSDVALIGQDNDADVGAAVLFDFLEPAVHVVEAFLVSEVKNNQYAVGTFVVCLRYRTVALLASGVPYLQTHSTLVDLKCSESEVYPNCSDIVLLKLIVLLRKN